MPAISLYLDASQARLKHDRLGCLAGGGEWDVAGSSGVWFDQGSGRVFLRPAPTEAAWLTSGAGDYARYRKSQTSVAADTAWREYDVSTTGIGDWVLTRDAPNGDPVYFPSQPRNGAVWLSVFPYGVGAGGDSYVECGLGATPATSRTSLRIFVTSGRVEVYRRIDGAGDPVKFAEGKISGSRDQGAKLAQQYVAFMLIPVGGRELMILSTAGGSYSCVMPDVPESEADGEIWPAAPFWVAIDAPQQPTLQVAPIFFARSGVALTQLLSFRRPPHGEQEGQDVIDAFGYGLGGVVGELRAPSGGTYAATKDARIRLELSGSGRDTPFVWGAMAEFPPIPGTCPGSGTNYASYMTTCRWDVGDDGLGGVSAEVELHSPAEIEASVARLRTLDRRPVQVFPLIDGVGGAPQWREAVSDRARRLTLPISDRSRIARELLISEATPFDGRDLVDAFWWLADLIGVDLEIDDPGVTIPLAGEAGAKGEWGTLIEVGDTVESWIRRLHESYLSTWFLALCPKTDGGSVLRVLDPAGMSETPTWTLYSSISDAIAIGGHSHANAWKYVYRTLDTTYVGPEANEVVVVGRDLRTGKPIVVTKRDAAAQDPGTATNARPEAWAGYPLKYGWRDENGINSDSAARRCCELLFARLSQGWRLREFECEALFHADGRPGWKGDVVQLHGVGPVRIKTLSGQMVKDEGGSDSLSWRPVRYVAEDGLRAAPLRTARTSARTIADDMRRGAARRRAAFGAAVGTFVGRGPRVAVVLT